VTAGGNRQELHELIRQHSQTSANRIKKEGLSNDLIERLKKDKSFKAVHDKLDTVMESKNYIGLAESQTERFIKTEIDPIIKENPNVGKIKSNVEL
jgi:adenylosuccinate lyase